MEYFQQTAQVNYPNDYDFTRITEFKHFLDYPPFRQTTVAREFSMEYVEAVNEPYYPIPSAENHSVYKKYRDEASRINDRVYFIGRLAEYKYYNMDQVVGRALNFYEKYFKQSI
jgi:UDP-galactopyranose mutase